MRWFREHWLFCLFLVMCVVGFVGLSVDTLSCERNARIVVLYAKCFETPQCKVRLGDMDMLERAKERVLRACPAETELPYVQLTESYYYVG